MRQLLKSLLILSPLAATTVLASIAQGKALAEILGPDGSGQFFLAAAFLSVMTTFGAIGIQSALTKLVAESRGASQPELIWQSVILGVCTVSIVSAVLMAILLLGQSLLSNFLLGGLSSTDRTFIVAASAAALIPAGWSLAMLGFLRGLGDVKSYSFTASVATVFALVAVVSGAAAFGFQGAFVGAICGQIFSAVAMGFVAARRTARLGLAVTLSVRVVKALFPRLLALGLLALVAGLAPSFGQSAIRSYLGSNFDLSSVGFFAAAWSITNRLPTLLYQTFSAYLMPLISSFGRDWKRITVQQNHALRLALLAGTPVLCAVIAGAPLVVRLLLSKEFLPMTNLLRLMVLGELFSLIYWATSMALYPSGRSLTNAACEWSWWIVFGVCTLAFTQADGLLGVGYAYILSYAVLALAVYGVEKRHHDLRWARENIRLVAVASAATLAITATSTLASDTPLLIGSVLALVLLAWPLVALTPSERSLLFSRFVMRRSAA